MSKPERFIIEFIKVGQLVKVNAICERTGREVSMVGDPRVSKMELERLAAKKLRYVLNKEAQQRQANKRGFSV
jgi:Domain of unknown function (DUF6898)